MKERLELLLNKVNILNKTCKKHDVWRLNRLQEKNEDLIKTLKEILKDME